MARVARREKADAGDRSRAGDAAGGAQIGGRRVHLLEAEQLRDQLAGTVTTGQARTGTSAVSKRAARTGLVGRPA